MPSVHRVREVIQSERVHDPKDLPWWQDWTGGAECRKYPPEWFYDYGRNSRKINRAKWVCHHCPVLAECRRDNMKVPYGIFGGMTWLERWRYLGNTGYPSRGAAYQFFERRFTVYVDKLKWLSNREGSGQNRQNQSSTRSLPN
jgi:WhiB family redox-sensing transcriptional regulator